MEKLLGLLGLVIIGFGIYFLFFMPSVDQKFNNFFNSKSIDVNEEYRKDSRNLIITVVDGEGIKEGDALKLMSAEFASQIYHESYSGYEYSKIVVVFKSIDKEILLEEKAEYKVDELRYEFDSQEL